MFTYSTILNLITFFTFFTPTSSLSPRDQTRYFLISAMPLIVPFVTKDYQPDIRNGPTAIQVFWCLFVTSDCVVKPSQRVRSEVFNFRCFNNDLRRDIIKNSKYRIFVDILKKITLSPLTAIAFSNTNSTVIACLANSMKFKLIKLW